MPEEFDTEGLGKSADEIRAELRDGVQHHNKEPETIIPSGGETAPPADPPADPPTTPTPSSGEEGEAGGETPAEGEAGVGQPAESSAEPGDGEGEKPSSDPTENDFDKYFTTTGEETPPAEGGEGEQPAPISDFDFESVSERTGLEIGSEDDIVNAFRDLKNQDPIDNLNVSDLMKNALKIEAKGGDLRQYFGILGTQTETLSDKESLRQKFFNESADLVKTDRDFANEKFEKHFEDKFGIVATEQDETDFDTVEEYAQYKRDRSYAVKELKWEAQSSRDNIKKSQDEVLNDYEVQGQPQITQEEADAIANKYKADVQNFEDTFEAVQIPIDKEGKVFYNLGLNDQTQPVLNEWMESPEKFLEYIGIGQDQSIDTDKLFGHMALAAAFTGTGEHAAGTLFAKHLLERSNKGTVETRLEHPLSPNNIPSEGGGSVNETQEAIDAFRQSVQGDMGLRRG